MAEPLEVKKLDFGPLAPKDWVIAGRAYQPDGRRKGLSCGKGFMPSPEYPTYLSLVSALDRKFKTIKEKEVRYKTYQIGDARLILVAFGSMARVAKEAMEMAREEGLKVRLFHPITLFPFPLKKIRASARPLVKFLVVEDNLGQILEDVEMAVAKRCPVHFLGMLVRHEPREMGMIFPEKLLEKIKEVYETEG